MAQPREWVPAILDYNYYEEDGVERINFPPSNPVNCVCFFEYFQGNKVFPNHNVHLYRIGATIKLIILGVHLVQIVSCAVQCHC